MSQPKLRSTILNIQFAEGPSELNNGNGIKWLGFRGKWLFEGPSNFFEADFSDIQLTIIRTRLMEIYAE